MKRADKRVVVHLIQLRPHQWPQVLQDAFRVSRDVENGVCVCDRKNSPTRCYLVPDKLFRIALTIDPLVVCTSIRNESPQLFDTTQNPLSVSVGNQHKWDTLRPERLEIGRGLGELPEGLVVASSPF